MFWYNLHAAVRSQLICRNPNNKSCSFILDPDLDGSSNRKPHQWRSESQYRGWLPFSERIAVFARYNIVAYAHLDTFKETGLSKSGCHVLSIPVSSSGKLFRAGRSERLHAKTLAMPISTKARQRLRARTQNEKLKGAQLYFWGTARLAVE